MTELEFLDRQEAAATRRLQGALLGGEDVEGAVEIVERVTVDHPLLAVGGAAVAGGLLGAVLGRTSGKTLVGLVRLARKPIWKALRRS